MNYRSCIGITMPENYIALFSTPTKEKALQLIGQAENVIDQAAACIKRDMHKRSWLKSGFIWGWKNLWPSMDILSSSE